MTNNGRLEDLEEDIPLGSTHGVYFDAEVVTEVKEVYLFSLVRVGVSNFTGRQHTASSSRTLLHCIKLPRLQCQAHSGRTSVATEQGNVYS